MRLLWDGSLVLLLFFCWVRLFLLLGASWFQVRQREQRILRLQALRAERAWPFVTVILPAYNEEDVIQPTLCALFSSDYPDFEVIVVDDGSQDQTAVCVQSLCAEYPRLRLLQEPDNQGKAHALNVGIAQAQADLVVVLDADTVVACDALTALVDNFWDPEICGVAGHIKVGNRDRFLTCWQSIEYITSINIERRAQSQLNCITILPGAISAYRKEALLSIGGYSTETVTEDVDVTLALLGAGYRLVYEERAIAWTEAPQRLRDLFQQRKRWITGSYQCLWKHRYAWWQGPNHAYRWIGYPHLLFLHVAIFFFLPLLVVNVLPVLQGASSASWVALLAFFVPEFVYSWCAYHFDNSHESKRPLWHFVWQRCFYLVFLGVVFVAVLGRFCWRGTIQWNKLPRSGQWMDKQLQHPTTTPGKFGSQ